MSSVRARAVYMYERMYERDNDILAAKFMKRQNDKSVFVLPQVLTCE